MEPLQLICTLDISSGANGTVSPSGTFSVNNGVNQQVTIKPNKNFTIDSLIVDGKKIDNTLNYNFNEIKNNHSLSVTFKPQSFFTLEAINKSNGVITPTKYDCDNSVSSYVFKVKPNRGYFIEKLLIDDLEVDPIMSNGGSFDSECLYSFKDISTSHTISAVFKKIPENLTFTTIGSGEKFVLGLTPAGDLWGHPIDGEKFNHPGYMQHFFAQKIDNNKYTNVFIDDNYDCNYFALSEDDSLYAWGGDSYRLPRNGSNRNIPQKVGRAKYSAISPSYKFAVAIKNENILCVWSEQNDKEIGLFSYSEGMPHVIAKGEFIAISTGSNHLLALGADGHLWAWGHNHNGQIGDNTTNACKVPKQIGNNTFVTIATGSAFSLALKTDGSLWAWGCNDKGQLGDGTTIDSLIPKKIGNDHFIAIATGAQHAIALKSDGKIFGWGLNIFARRDSIEDKIILNPKEIDSNSYLAISAIGNYATALRSDGSWWRWGPEMGFDYETKPHSDKKRAFTQILRIKKNKE